MGEGKAGVGVIDAVVLDVPDVEAAAGFWTALLDGRVLEEAEASTDWRTIQTREGWTVATQFAPNLVTAQWPGQGNPQQLHLDLRVADLAAATSTAVGLGATLLRENESWNTLADPAGHPFDLCLNDAVARTTLWGVTFDVPDVAVASRFWAATLGEEITFAGDGIAMLGGERTVMFQQVAHYSPPDWPDPQRPQQLHLDLSIHGSRPDDAQAAVLALGARRLPGGGDTFRVFADPAGHPFCLCWG